MKVYRCDLCGKEARSERDLNTMTRSIDGGRYVDVGDLCKDCYKVEITEPNAAMWESRYNAIAAKIAARKSA